MTEAVTEDAIQTAADSMASNAAAAAEAVAADAANEWNTQDEAFLKHLSENADEQEKALIAQIVPNYAMNEDQQGIAEPAAPAEPEATPEVVIRAALDALKELGIGREGRVLRSEFFQEPGPDAVEETGVLEESVEDYVFL